MPKPFQHPTVWLAVASIAFAGLLFADAHPALRGGVGWRWPHHPIPWINMGLLAALLAAYVIGGVGLIQGGGRGVRLWAFGGSIALALATAAGQHPSLGYTLFTRTASLVATGPHHAAANLDFLSVEVLQTWTERISAYDPDAETISRHVLLAPPGIPLFYDALNELLARAPWVARPLQMALIPYQCWNYALLAYTPAEWASAWFGVLMPVWAGLTVFPLYGLARRLGVDAAFTVLAWALVPAMASFAGSWNTVYPLLAVLAFYSFHIGLDRGAAWLVAGGAIYGLSTFLNFAPVPFALVMGVYTLVDHAHSERPLSRWYRPLVIGAWTGAGALLPWGVWMALGGASPLAILAASFSIHLELDRAYLPWLFLHTYDWALFAGVPVVALSAVMAFRPRAMGGKLAISLWVALVVLVLSGTARAETARVWSFFTPFVLLAAAGIWQIEPGRGGRAWVLVSSAALFFALTTTWDVFDAIDMKPLPGTPPAHTQLQPVNIDYGETFALVGWGASATDDAITLDLNWQARQRTATPYWFSVLWVGPGGITAPESVIWQGGQTNYPTTCWRTGEIIGDSVSLPLPDDLPPGDYWLSLAMFGMQDAPQDRLPVSLPDGTTDTQAGLGPVRIEPGQ